MSSTYDAIVSRYMERTKKSRELHNEAKRLLPRGVSSNFRVVDPNPIFIESAVGTTITERLKAKKLTSADGRFSSRALYPLGDAHAAEFYELWMAPHSREDAEPHRPGTRENLIVTSGKLELTVGNDSFHLEKGDAVNFSADQPHSYINRSGEECWMYLVMNYAGRK